MKIPMLMAAVIAGLSFSSCVPATPQARIAHSPEKFAGLSHSQQDLVSKGQISRDMPPDGVLLAWGAPERTFEGSKSGKRTTRWDYASTQAVYTTNFYGGYGGFGRYGYGRFYGAGFGLGPEIAYIPYRVASVWFIDDRVDSWERVR